MLSSLLKPAMRPWLLGAFTVAMGVWQRARKQARIIEMPTQYIYGTVPGSTTSTTSTTSATSNTSMQRYPLSIGFVIQLSAIEKQLLPIDSATTLALSYASMPLFGGVGAPSVSVANHADGYYVSIAYPDSASAPTVAQVKNTLEQIEPRLTGRIGDVFISR